MATHGEDALLAAIDLHFPGSAALRGDDCAVLATTSPLLVSTDLFLENAHFRGRYFLPEEIGHKALAVNISDIAAMAGRPLGFSLGLGLPASLDSGYFNRLLSGMARVANCYGLDLTGGDLSAADSLFISITIQGTAWGKNTPFLHRRAALPGDALLCVGALGLARLGLDQMEKQGRDAQSNCPLACAAHLTPEPLVEQAHTLLSTAMRFGLAHRVGLMDVSDGLARDLPRLVGPDLAVNLESGAVPVPEEVARCAGRHHIDAVRHCLLGGEDYALAVTCPESLAGHILDAVPEGCRIGSVVEGRGVLLDGKALNAAGFDHFSV